jgi:P3 major capsid protein
LAMAKKHRPAAQTLSTVVADKNQMLEVGENFPVLSYAALTEAGTETLRAVFEIPLAYSDDDLRGAVYANVVNATMNLQIQINQNALPANGADSTLALYTASASTPAGTLTDITVTVYQEYLDQLPIGKNGPVLPILDLSTVYELKNTNFTAITDGQDYPVPFANFRDFLSVFAVFNSTGAAGGLLDGSDVNYWALQSANFTNLWKVDPLEIARNTRDLINVDYPVGVYYFPFRRKPISTTQYGNMELILNADNPSSGAYCLIHWEDFALINTLTAAGSLAG